MKLGAHAFSIRQLQYVVAVADSLSFRQAASLCHVSQPSLSTQIAELERVLGLRLFERDRRRVLVTAAGKEIVDRARVMLREAEDLAEAARRFADPLAGSLRVGVIPTISPYLLPRIAPAIRKAFPRLSVYWVEDKTHALVRKLDGGTLDAALLALEAELGDVEQEVIARDPFVLVVPAGGPLAAKAGPARPSDLCDVGVLLLEDEHCFGRQALAFCAGTKARELEFRGTSLSTITQMVASGAGVTLLPELSVAAEGRRAGLRVRSFAKPVPGRTIGLVWRKRSPLAGALRQVAAVVRDAYPGARKGAGRALRLKPPTALA